jgi:hypothetical protein
VSDRQDDLPIGGDSEFGLVGDVRSSSSIRTSTPSSNGGGGVLSQSHGGTAGIASIHKDIGTGSTGTATSMISRGTLPDVDTEFRGPYGKMIVPKRPPILLNRQITIDRMGGNPGSPMNPLQEKCCHIGSRTLFNLSLHYNTLLVFHY